MQVYILSILSTCYWKKSEVLLKWVLIYECYIQILDGTLASSSIKETPFKIVPYKIYLPGKNLMSLRHPSGLFL